MKDQGGETREQILDAAMEHFAECGYKGASISKIAEEAGVSKSLIFWYFNTKEMLFQSLVDRFAINCINNLNLSGPSGNARVKMEYIIDSYWEFIRKNFKFVRIFMNWFIQWDSKDKRRRDRMKNIHSKFREILEFHIKEGINEGLFREDIDVHSTALSIVCCLEGLLLQIILESVDFNNFKENFYVSLKRHLFEGIMNQDSKA